LEYAISVFGIAVVSYFVSWMLLKSHRLTRLLIPDVMEEKAVFERAVREFYSSKIQHTKDRVGVLIFFSILERRAVVLTDEKIAQKLPNSTWEKLIEDLVRSKKQGRLGEGLVEKIQQTALHLATHFPRVAGDQNELGDHLVIKE
jgi:putative membrane protein